MKILFKKATSKPNESPIEMEVNSLEELIELIQYLSLVDNEVEGLILWAKKDAKDPTRATVYNGFIE